MKIRCPHCGQEFEPAEEGASPLRRARLEKGLSIPEASENVGMSSWALSRLERGSGNPKLSVLKTMATFYGKSIEELFPEPLEETEEEVEDESEDEAEE